LAMVSALIDSNVPQLKLLSKGKVRDIYATTSPEHLLFVASDRISAYDVILKNGIPDKGRILTELSLFWFDKLKDIIPNHVVTSRIKEMPEEVHQQQEQLEGRSILVRKAEVIPLEAIVRGYLTGKRPRRNSHARENLKKAYCTNHQIIHTYIINLFRVAIA